MLPVTPTPFPPGTAHFEIPQTYSLWGSTDMVIQFWNWTGDGGTVFQLIALIVLVIAGVLIAWKFTEKYIRRDAES